VARPDVLVVVPTLGNRPEWLRTCLSSIAQQSVCARVLLVGPAAAGLHRWQAEYSADVLDVDAPGLSVAINRGFETGEEQFVTWLGDDDLLAPASLERVRAALIRKPHASFAYGRTRYIDSVGDTIGVTHPGHWAARYLTLGKDFVPQPGSLIRREALRGVGLLDESLRNAMDLDLFIRLLRWGPATYVRHEVSAYRLHEASITTTKGAGDESESVRLRYVRPAAAARFARRRRWTRRADRVIDVMFRRLPAPRVPRYRGEPYTQAR
jgi:GT2 family glycosyltransferase